MLNGRREIWRPLKTTDRDEAKARSSAWTARIERLFVTLKKHGECMTKEEHEVLAARWPEADLDCRGLQGFGRLCSKRRHMRLLLQITGRRLNGKPMNC